MKLKYSLYTILILFIFLFWPINAGYSADGIKWYTYDEGLALGKTKKKTVFLHFYANWCSYCQKMGKKTFQDPSVISYLNTHFVSIRVNTDKERKIAANYRVRGLPTTWILKENGEKIGPIPGYITPDNLLLMLKKIIAMQNKANL